MLDIKYIRENQKEVEETLAKRGLKFDLNHLLEIDGARRKLIAEVENLRHDKREAAEKRDTSEGKKIKEKLAKKEIALAAVQQEFANKLAEVPNLVLAKVPVGDESANEILKKVGEPPKFDFSPKDHVQIGQDLDLIDIPRAVKVAGSRFYFLKNEAALIELALVQMATKLLVKEGFTPIIPPSLVKKEVTDSLGYWQGGGNENFYLVSDYEVGGAEEGKPLPYYLIGTGEHALVPMHANEVLGGASQLPKRYVAVSSCYRREAGSYGKDTHGILRVHQFEKIEMVSLVRPEEDERERGKLLSLAEDLVKSLELPYRVVRLASEDLAFPSAETIDIETWLPAQKKYRETHSISTTSDFQARRLNIKYRSKEGARLVHILNGTAIAIPRILIAILENHQQRDGSIKLPKVLHEYLGKDTIRRTE